MTERTLMRAANMPKKMPLGLRPRERHQTKHQMAVYVLRNSAIFKAELAISNNMEDGDNGTQHTPPT